MTPLELADIHAASFTQPRPWSVDEFASLLASDHTRLLTSANGFALIQIAGPEAELLTIAVQPDARRSGQGRDLLTRALTSAKAANCEEIFLEVVEDNTAAIALYRTLGFADRAIRKDYYNGPNGTKSSAVIMHRSI